MPTHTFAVGQSVVFAFRQRGRPSTTLRIVKQMPIEGSEVYYRVKSADENYERTVAEHDLRAFESTPRK